MVVLSSVIAIFVSFQIHGRFKQIAKTAKIFFCFFDSVQQRALFYFFSLYLLVQADSLLLVSFHFPACFGFFFHVATVHADTEWFSNVYAWESKHTMTGRDQPIS